MGNRQHNELARSEEELRKSESRLKEAEQIASLGHWELDLVSNCLLWSDEIFRIFELVPQEFNATYEAFLERVHPDDQELVNKAYTDSLKNRTGYDIVHRLLLKNGKIKFVHEKCRTEYDEDGNPLRSLGTVQDITERRLVEEELRRYRDHLEELVAERTAELERARDDRDTMISKLQNALTQVKQISDYLENLFESIPCGVLVFDAERRIKSVNNVLEQTFRISKTEVIDECVGNALRCIHASENPEGCGFMDVCTTCQIRQTALRALDGNRVHRSKANVQLLVNGKACDLLFLVSAAPVDYEGERLAIVILEDITELNGLRRRLKAEQGFSGIVGRDKKIQELFDTIRELAESKVPVLIEGESGTGKELVAAAIHNEGPRAGKQFVPVNCGALPDGLLESELFGHVKGAFTGAFRDKKGRFQLADGGTIFLDEVGDLSPAMQVKLLRVLQEGRFEPVGSEKTVEVDVRVISATNKSLKQEVAKGRFREDLFYRICVVPMTLPPLRERPNDIPLLAEHFLEQDAKKTSREKASLSPEALPALMDYQWPGNVRELQNNLQFALIKSRGKDIEPEHLPSEIFQAAGAPVGKRRRKRKLEEGAVAQAMEEAKSNKVRAAKLLGVSRATLYRFLAEHMGE